VVGVRVIGERMTVAVRKGRLMDGRTDGRRERREDEKRKRKRKGVKVG